MKDIIFKQIRKDELTCPLKMAPFTKANITKGLRRQMNLARELNLSIDTFPLSSFDEYSLVQDKPPWLCSIAFYSKQQFFFLFGLFWLISHDDGQTNHQLELCCIRVRGIY
jgi:hypothetical protein